MYIIYKNSKKFGKKAIIFILWYVVSIFCVSFLPNDIIVENVMIYKSYNVNIRAKNRKEIYVLDFWQFYFAG